MMMPVMDGFTFLHHLLARSSHADVPVIVATARVLTEGERAALATVTQRVIEKNAHTREELLALIGDQIHDMFHTTDPSPDP